MKANAAEGCRSAGALHATREALECDSLSLQSRQAAAGRSPSCANFSSISRLQMRSNRRLIEAMDDFVQETGDDEALGDLTGMPRVRR